MVNNNGRHAVRERSGTVTLDEGRHLVEVAYFEATRNQLLEVSYAGPGISKQLIPNEVLFLNEEEVLCENVALSTQTEVDAFDCSAVLNLTIDITDEDNDPIVDLSNLSLLEVIGKDLIITSSLRTSSLTSLEGLSSLTTIDGDFILSANLPNLQGLDQLRTIGGSLKLSQEASELESLVGLASLESIGGDLSFLEYTLEDFTGLANLKTIGGEISFIASGGTVNFNGLSALESVGGLALRGSFIPDFVGLSALTTITGQVAIEAGTGGVGSFRGLESLETISGDFLLELTDKFEGWEGLNNLRRIGGDLQILLGTFDNLAGLESLEEIDGTFRVELSQVESLQGLSSLQWVGGLSLVSLDVLTSSAGLEALRQIDGDINIDRTAITNVSALEGVERVGGAVNIIGNLNLSACCVLPELAERTIGEVTLRDNAAGCNVVTQIERCDDKNPSPDIWLEAECASVGDYWKPVSVRFSASGGSYLQANVQGAGPDNLPREDPRRQIAFTVQVPQAGIYKIFARQRADDDDENSFFFRVNDGDWMVWNTFSAFLDIGFEWGVGIGGNPASGGGEHDPVC